MGRRCGPLEEAGGAAGQALEVGAVRLVLVLEAVERQPPGEVLGGQELLEDPDLWEPQVPR